jgi:hypothetical protein
MTTAGWRLRLPAHGYLERCQQIRRLVMRSGGKRASAQPPHRRTHAASTLSMSTCVPSFDTFARWRQTIGGAGALPCTSLQSGLRVQWEGWSRMLAMASVRAAWGLDGAIISFLVKTADCEFIVTSAGVPELLFACKFTACRALRYLVRQRPRECRRGGAVQANIAGSSLTRCRSVSATRWGAYPRPILRPVRFR